MNKEKIVEDMFNKGILLSKDILEKELDESLITKIKHEGDLLVLNADYADVIVQQTSLVDWYEIDRYKVDAEKTKSGIFYQERLQALKNKGKETEKEQAEKTQIETEQAAELETHTSESSDISDFPKAVEIIASYENIPVKYEVKNFTQLFVSRYRFLESLLRNRQELQNMVAISRLLSKKEKENVSLIGLVEEIGETKNGNLMLTVEDLTGRIKVFISKDKKDLFQQAKDLVLDEVIGVFGVLGDKIVFAEEVVWPDIPPSNVLKKSDKEEYVIFLSDIHLGSNLFMKEEFNKFLNWIKGDIGSKSQNEIAEKVKYIIIAGDLVDGIGIYPSQIEDLEIKDVMEQYEEFCKLIKTIPIDKEIILCPGNHDATHLAEPQTSFNETFSPTLFNLPNVTMVTNPGQVNIAKTKDFPGFNILLYHGSSFDYYVNNVESIRNNGGYHRADLIMKFLLKRRHLAPSFKSTPYFPAHKEDPLLIKQIPDFLISGHIHYSSVANYKGITMICGSCWQEKTPFQEKLGHDPEPARVPIVNLKTREIKILKFG